MKPSSAVEEHSFQNEVDGISGRELMMLRAAYRVMARRGSSRLKLQDVADEAKVSKGLITYYFGTKDALVQQAMEWALMGTARRIRTSLRTSTQGDPLGPLLDAIFVSAQANRDFQLVYLDLVEHSVRHQAFAELPAMTREIIEGLYAEVISDGVERGLFRVDDVEQAAVMVRAVIDGTFLQWLQRSDWEVAHADFKAQCREALLKILS